MESPGFEPQHWESLMRSEMHVASESVTVCWSCNYSGPEKVIGRKESRRTSSTDCKLSTWEARTRIVPWVWDQPQQHNEFKEPGLQVVSCLKKKKKRKAMWEGKDRGSVVKRGTSLSKVLGLIPAPQREGDRMVSFMNCGWQNICLALLRD